MKHLIYIYLIISSFLLGRLYQENVTWEGGYLELMKAGLIISLLGVLLYMIANIVKKIKQNKNK